MGGTFDPLHIGHLVIAEQARELMSLDEVWFLPSNQPPHKERSPVANSLQRLEMVRRAIAGHPNFHVCEIEFDRGGISYSMDTAAIMKERYPDYCFQWIIGSDMVQYLPRWYRIEEMIQMVSFVGLERPGFVSVQLELPDWLKSSVTMIKMIQLDISSRLASANSRISFTPGKSRPGSI